MTLTNWRVGFEKYCLRISAVMPSEIEDLSTLIYTWVHLTVRTLKNILGIVIDTPSSYGSGWLLCYNNELLANTTAGIMKVLPLTIRAGMDLALFLALL